VVVRSRRRGSTLLFLLLSLTAAGVAAWLVLSEDGLRSRAIDSRIPAAIRAHNASFAPSRETLRAWALFDDVRCSLHVTDESPPRVAIGAATGSGSWFVIYVDGDEVDYDSYLEGSALSEMADAPGVGDPERFLSTETACSVHEGGVLRTR
jgi:hypothetical protein